MIGNIIILIKKHWLIMIVSLLIGLVISGPNLFFIYNQDYRGIPLMYTDAEDYYLGRINAGYYGCIMSCNPFTKTTGDVLPFYDPSISTFILALPGIIFNISVINLKLIYEFLLPFILSILMYSLVFKITQNKLISVGSVVFIMLGFNLLNIDNFFYISNLEYWGFIPYSRIVNPDFSSIFFFIYLHIFLSTLHKPTKIKYLLLGLFFGLSFYIYFYTYMFLISIQLTSIIIFLFRKDFKNMFGFILTSVVGFIIGIPIIIELFQLTHDPLYGGLYHMGIEKTHSPSISLFGITAFFTCAIIFILYVKIFEKISTEVWFMTILILSCFAVENQHIFTGTIIQYFHFDYYYITPIFIILICFILSLNSKKSYWKDLIICIFLIAPILNSISIQYKIYKKEMPDTVSKQSMIDVLRFLNSNIPKKTVIVAPEIQSLLPIYTHLYGIWSENTELYYLHTEEQKNEAGNALKSAEYLRLSINKYNAEYLVLSKMALSKINFNIKEFIDSMIYSDKYFNVYKLKK